MTMKKRSSEITAHFRSDIKTVWDTVTNNEDYRWRSDLSHVEITNEENSFIEYTHKGQATKFTITKKNPYKEYAFDLENKLFTGSWKGLFCRIEAGGTKVIFREDILIHNFFIRFLSYFLMNLKKMQGQYIMDLKKKLGE